ncbi:NeuD/PglB/VioB family sugar acetyltransferase [Anaerocolumna xylanovorans]|uniref:Sugar O-acyltransferase, sialic acid O-acetyltransferase NeuD family n=1 Tax=Anaerocolumna xylanovorans DSM 12503 TaxID=1121345 RepID=A0A1M7Y4B3_9FIRM|nr:NeuD/PglB/VioB family sugar acetyltransferase [Anaerocolumna xylanovorans]SHO47120.1 sugar O-acyltransferase, sialic acid O-acetyltransferase NeuD family [Anaerocolumna xylanovorans DSM 12503]
MSKFEILMPRLGTNDNFVTIGLWNVKNGDMVKAGQIIAIIETTKETQDLEAEKDGYIYLKYVEGDDVEVGKVIAYISAEKEELNEEKTSSTVAQLNITKKALELAEKNGIDLSKLDSSKMIREKDILVLLGEKKVSKRNIANDVIIVSGGGVAKMCIDILRESKNYNIAGITDIKLKTGNEVMGVPVLGNDDILDELKDKGYMLAVNAIGGIANDNTGKLFFLRENMYNIIKSKGFFMPNIIHPNAFIESSAELGEGNLLLAGAIVGSDVKIGNDCIINTGAIVSHDCIIEDHAKISPGAILAGNVQIGENSLIGMGVTIYIGVKIGKNVIISNGKNIFSDVPDNSIIM